jgi:hypothetical protein
MIGGDFVDAVARDGILSYPVGWARDERGLKSAQRIFR